MDGRLTMKMKQRAEFGIVGSGVIGLCTAYFLAEAGHSVTVIERERTVGAGASRGNGGQFVFAKPLPSPGMVRNGLRHLIGRDGAFYVAPLAMPGLAGFLSRFALSATPTRFMKGMEKLAVLNELTMPLLDSMKLNGIGTRIEETGNLRIFADQTAAEADHAGALERAGNGFNSQPGRLMYGEELWDYEPALGAAAKFGYVQPDLRWGDPSVFIDELISHLKRIGVEFVTNSEVTAVEESDNAVEVRHNDQTSSFSSVLLAAGPWSAPLMKAAGSRAILKPGVGYSFSVRAEHTPGHVLALENAHVGVTPLEDGWVRFAGTMEFTGSDNGKTSDRVQAIAEASKPYVSGMDWDSLKDEWSAARPMTPDGLPYIGQLPGRQRTAVATGHNMLGLTLGPATGMKTAELLLSQGADPRMKAFAVDRHIIF
ncbi:D-amino-acid dehydrogenase [Arthrobacter sp. UYEF36]